MEQERVQEADQGGYILPFQAEALMKILEWRVGKNDCCWPSQRLLAEDMGICVRQVQAWLSFLVSAGLIEVKRMSRSRAGRHINHYFILPSLTPMRGQCAANARKSAPYIARISAPYNARISAPLSLDELNPLEGVKSEEAIPLSPLEEISEMQHEHPRTEEEIENNLAFDDLTDDAREKIESIIREDYPLWVSEAYSFRVACVRLMVQHREDGKLKSMQESAEFEQGWEEFRRKFIAQVPGCPKADTDFLDRVKMLFGPPSVTGAKGINATATEMIDALECYLSDDRRKREKWPGNFAREAYRFLPDYVTAARYASAKASHAEAKAAAVPAPNPPPEPMPIAVDTDLVSVSESVRERIGAARFELWFAGNTRFTRGEGGVLMVVTKTLPVHDFIKRTFRSELESVVKSKVMFMFDPKLFEGNSCP